MLHLAVAADAILVTFDADFGEMLVRRRALVPLGVAYLRIVPADPEEAGRRLMQLLASGTQLDGFLTVVGRSTVRQRALTRG